jgi:hypothetical protein
MAFIEHLFAMARRPGSESDDPDSFAVAKAKETIKQLSPEARAFLMAWFVKFYGDSGMMFTPSYTQRRKRVVVDEESYWLVKIPTK